MDSLDDDQINSSDNHYKSHHSKLDFTKIRAQFKKNFDKIMHKSTTNINIHSTGQTNTSNHLIDYYHTPNKQAISLQDSKKFEFKNQMKMRATSVIDKKDIIKLQQRMYEKLKKEVERKRSESERLKQELDDLRAQIESRNMEIVGQSQIDKLREEIRILTNKKAELEFTVRKCFNVWQCRICTYENKEEFMTCYMCNNDREDDIYICSYCYEKNLLISNKCKKCNLYFDFEENENIIGKK